MLSVFLSLWAIFLVIAAFFVFKLIFNDLPIRFIDKRIQIKRFVRGEYQKSDEELLQWVRSFDSKEFEEYVAYLFERNGYKTAVVGQTRDHGIDVIAKKNEKSYFIQCKRFTDFKVKVEHVRDFYGAITDELNGGKGYFVTTGEYTKDAKDFAKDKPLQLLNKEDLVIMIRRTKDKEALAFEN